MMHHMLHGTCAYVECTALRACQALCKTPHDALDVVEELQFMAASCSDLVRVASAPPGISLPLVREAVKV
jgi:hypothetical protein